MVKIKRNRETARSMLLCFCLFASVLLLAGCSALRFVPDDEAMLSSVKMQSDSKQISPGSYRAYVRQEPNSRWFSLMKVPLGVYCMQGKDSLRRFNRFIRRIGEGPVIYNEAETKESLSALKAALNNHGFLHASVEADTSLVRGKRVNLRYKIHPGLRTYVGDIHYEFDDAEVEKAVMKTISSSKLYRGMPLDASLLNDERSRLVNLLRDQGYYHLHKEFVSFRADTAADDYSVNLTLRVKIPNGMDSTRVYQKFKIRKVNIYEDVAQGEEKGVSPYHGLDIYYGDGLKMYRRVYDSHMYIRPDSLYRATDLRNTYSSINSLPSVGYSAVRFREVPTDSALLDCDVNVNLNMPNSVSAEVEGTNTSGNLGAALVLTYSNKNIFRGAESLSLKLRGAYEAITGLEGYNNQNYLEYSAEAALRFPSFLFPGISERHRQGLKANSELNVMYDSQNRPEFHRRVLTGGWTYRWSPTFSPRWRHRLDLVSLNYVFMPWISDTFRKEYLEGDDPHYAVLRYSYENLFIMRMGYSFTYNSLNTSTAMGLYHTNGYQIRFNVESAGNLLYGMSKLLGAQRVSSGQYSLMNIAYSQYAKVDFDYAKSFVIDERNSMALHAGFGVALPYGNSSILPYEKRYFSGGANSVRGWGVRELGPGSYKGNDGKIDFINQTGNLKLDLSVEYRTHLFWKFHGAAFIDAGNIWNTKNYADQPGGQFRFDRFYKQIAVSYGLGLRFNLDYFVLRLDAGMKAINPTVESGKGHYPVIHPVFSRDFTFHFAVGLPF